MNRKGGKIAKHEELLLPESHGRDEDEELKPTRAVIDPDGVTFRSYSDGSAHYFTAGKINRHPAQSRSRHHFRF